MRAEEFLTEAATDIVYHYTSTHNAARIMKDGVFKLAATGGNDSESQYAPAGYPFFFSTTRSKVGDYHRYLGTGGVMFVLDGRWLSSRYPVKPIDYWDRSWQHTPDRTREAEDRVFSRDSEIPIDGVTAVHVLLKEPDESRSPLTRQILIAAKKRKIPAYLYNDEAAFRTQNTAKAIDISQAGDLLKGQEVIPGYRRPTRGLPARRGGEPWGKSSIYDWVELIKKQPGQALSKSADKLRYNITYYGDHSNALKNDLFNARKPSGGGEYELANRLQAYMQTNNLNVKTLADQLKQKWKQA